MKAAWITTCALAAALVPLSAGAERVNFPVGIPIEDFREVFTAQLALEGQPGIGLRQVYCRSEIRVACHYELAEGLKLTVSGDERDGMVDLFTLVIVSELGLDPMAAAAILAVVRLSDPALSETEIEAGLARMVATVWRDHRSITERFVTESVTFRLVLSPLQGTIFTATPNPRDATAEKSAR